MLKVGSLLSDIGSNCARGGVMEGNYFNSLANEERFIKKVHPNAPMECMLRPQTQMTNKISGFCQKYNRTEGWCRG